EVKTLYDSYRWPTREEEAILGQECLKGNAEAREILAIIGMKIIIFRIQQIMRKQYKRYWDLHDKLSENIFYTNRAILDFSNMRDVVTLYDPGKGFRLATLLYKWFPDESIRQLIKNELEKIVIEGMSIDTPLGDNGDGFTLLDTLRDDKTEDPLEYLEKKEIIGYIVAKYKEYRNRDIGKAEDLFLAVLNIVMGQHPGKVDEIKKALKDEGFVRWDIGREGIRLRMEKGKLILARVLKERGIVMSRREDNNGFASPSVAGGEQKLLPGGLMSSSPVKRPKLTGQESVIFKEVVKEAIAGEFKGLFDRVARNIAEEFMITLSRERVRNALSDVRRKFGIRVDKTSVKGTRATISGLPELILKAKKLKFREVRDITEEDIEKIKTRESNPINIEARKILIFALQGDSPEDIAKIMNFPSTSYIYSRAFYSVYGKIPKEAKGKRDNWRHSQLISAARYALEQGWISAGDISGADKVINNPLSNREKSILEIAVSNFKDNNNEIAGILNLKPHTIQVFVDGIANKLGVNKDGRNTLIECVKAGYAKGYINCDKDSYDIFILSFYNRVRLNKAETEVLVYSALGFSPDKVALKSGLDRKHITTSLYGSIRQKLNVRLEPNQKMLQVMDAVITIALKKKAISESDILSALWSQDREERLPLVKHLLSKGYFEVLKGVLNKLSKKLAAEEAGVCATGVIAEKEFLRESDGAAEEERDGGSFSGNPEDTRDIDAALPDSINPDFNKLEYDDTEEAVLSSYLAFRYPTREEQKILVEAVKRGKAPDADAKARARAKQAQDRLINGTMQHIIRQAGYYNRNRRFSSHVSLFDLAHEAIEYVIRRLDKFDPDKGDFAAFVTGKRIPGINMTHLEVQFSRIITAKSYANGARLPVDIFSR
ncbi:MAG: LuxR C-terminal-related transcriptional regulator, partial [Candidatus Omnitrophica bacterium]|nr:LuxR C-terminal-related transcriptional regulator [Candidatus Omnitrophota bacterium]